MIMLPFWGMFGHPQTPGPLASSVPSSQKGKLILSSWFPIVMWPIQGGAQELKIQTPDCNLQFRQELLENALPSLWILGLDVELLVPSR